MLFLLSGTKDIVLSGDNKEEINKNVGDVLVAKSLLSIISFLALGFLIPFIPILKEHILFTFLSYVVVFLTIFLMDFYFRGIERMEIITIRFLVMKAIATIFTFVFLKEDDDLLWIPILDIVGSVFAVALVFLELKKLDVIIRPSGISSALNN